MKVEMVRCAAQDADVVWAARVSTAGERSLEDLGRDPNEAKGLIRYLLLNRHGTPFEHNSFTFFVNAPIFVFREFQRHRVGLSFNEWSGRYAQLEPEFYLPGPDRPLVQVGKTGHYEFVPGTDEQYETVRDATETSCRVAYEQYERMLAAGVAREVARGVLPVATYSSMFVTMNARSIMHFLSLRTKDLDSKFPSYPQYEIELVARQIEVFFAEAMPIAHAAFEEGGRVAP